MRTVLVILSSIIFAVGVYGQTKNYCASTMCPAGVYHVACVKKNVFAATCPKDAKIIAPTNYQKILLAEHNRVRNEIASAKLTGYEAAMRMGTLVWDDELARLALTWAKQCEQVKDDCRNTDRFSSVGQNVHTTTRNGNYNVTALLINIVDTWYNEYTAMDVAFVAAYTDGAAYANFAQMILDKVTRVGCATVEYVGVNTKIVNTFCNYDSEPLDAQPLYVQGCATAQCLNGRNTEYTGLCPAKEVIDPNWQL